MSIVWNVSTLLTMPCMRFVFNLSDPSGLGRTCVILSTMPPSRLLSTGMAARELGIGASTLAHWWADGKVTPEFVTAGGHARWDLDDLRRQIEEWRRRDQDEAPDQ